MNAMLNEKPNAEKAAMSETPGVILDGRYLPAPTDHDGRQWVRANTLIQGTPEDLYTYWRDLASIPLWQDEIESVTPTGPTTSHWVMKSGDKTVEWDSEIFADEPGKRIAWSSIHGEVQNAGEVMFQAAPNGTETIVTVLQSFKAGMIASALKTFTGRNPKQGVVENLRHFKALVETGEIPRTQGQPHGPRGSIGDAKKSLYGEGIDTPPGSNSTAD